MTASPSNALTPTASNTTAGTADHVHIPVLLDAVVDALNPTDGETYVDGTFGRGGYARAVLNRASCTLYGMDRDPHAIAVAKQFENQFPSRFTALQGSFSSMTDQLATQGLDTVDGILLDIGVSSPQIDDPLRGFSFRFDGPLDMRMSLDGISAQDIVNTYDEGEIADIIYKYGEERHSRRIAKKIVSVRAETPFTTTFQLADVVRSVVPKSRDGIDPATRTFQGLRIAVNDELGELERVLQSSLSLLKAGGRLVVVTFHSLEDRIVKQFLHRHSKTTTDTPRHLPITGDAVKPLFTQPNRKAIPPTDVEIAENPRCRSAKLRYAIRTETPYPLTA